jgi:2-polyprenyl-3-methyl-5-hydroxy-6-metoxy-1,4-benzoquinol methylase
VQQDQTRDFFHRIADRWQKQAIGSDDAYNIVNWRNQAVLSTLDELPTACRLLDVGCGTGQLAIEAAKRGLEAIGIDFAQDMIEQCMRNGREAGVNATFRCESFFQMSPKKPFDVISAQGFIEYISSDELELFLARSAAALRPGGAAVVGSRNRLFNIVSLNKFTEMERQLGLFEALLEEAIAFQTSATQEAAFSAVTKLERIDPQPASHPDTGIGVDVRYQYAPSELIKRARAYGFAPNKIYPIHYHALPISSVASHPALHGRLATAIQELAPADSRFVPYASSFVLDLRKI